MSVSTIAVVTGSRAEFGLLRSVMRAIRDHPRLRLATVVAGSHLLAPAETVLEVAGEFEIDERVTMQVGGDGRHDGATGGRTCEGRLADAEAAARGMAGFCGVLRRLAPQAVVVLGDRIEAFAAASAASIAGAAVAHIHGGDRAEGIADESMRHAITKLSHIHFAATRESAERLARMGEDAARIHLVGSPAIDIIGDVEPMSDAAARELGDPRAVVLLHPSGQSAEHEAETARRVSEATRSVFGRRVLALSPNHDAGRGALLKEINMSAEKFGWRRVEHVPRETFVGLLKRLSVDQTETRGVLVGNSSAGLIEAAATRTMCVNIPPRQNGRERGGNVLDYCGGEPEGIEALLRAAQAAPGEQVPGSHPYGDGTSGKRIAAILAATDLTDPALVRKRNWY
ncbi:MAG: UDP-N-acetylglucosamine 2-epimerase [Phycisphaerales bacterium]